MKDELKKIDVEVVETGKASLEIRFPEKKQSAHDEFHSPIEFKTYHDHRMAMAFAPLALIYPEIKIHNPDVVRKSYPDFWNDMKTMGFEIKEEN